MIFPYEYDITLDINNTQTINYSNVQLTQGDTDAYRFSISLKTDGTALDLAGRTVTITFLKADGESVVGNCTISNATDGECYYILGTTEVQVAGRLLVTVEVYESTSRITTNRFAVSVKEQLNDGAGIESTTEYPILTSLIADAQEVVNETTGKIGALDGRVETIENQDLDIRVTEVEYQINEHLDATMPHQFQDVDADKTYRYGLKQEDGHMKFIYEEVTE